MEDMLTAVKFLYDAKTINEWIWLLCEVRNLHKNKVTTNERIT